MWEAQVDAIENRPGQRYRVTENSIRLTFARVISLWKSEPAFRSFYSRLLSDSPYEAFRWEAPRLTTTTLDRDYEFVLLPCDELIRSADSWAFSEYFDTKTQVATFPNLGRDAMLVVPCPVGDESAYAHLGAFLRHAPESQTHQLWISVAAAMQQRLGDSPVWLNTAGMGISWLHVRLDDRPKYYAYDPYRKSA